MKGVEFLINLAETIMPVGSRITCNPPPVHTDQDYLVFVSGHKQHNLDSVMSLIGAQYEDDENYRNATGTESAFKSYRLGNINFIVTSDSVFHERFLAATSRAKELNLTLKSERVALFQTVLYGVNYDQPEFN